VKLLVSLVCIVALFAVNTCLGLPDTEHDTLSSAGIMSIVDRELQTTRFTSLLPQGRQFLDETQNYFAELSEKMACLESIEAQQRGGLAGSGDDLQNTRRPRVPCEQRCCSGRWRSATAGPSPPCTTRTAASSGRCTACCATTRSA
jgi:hypothetical protein